MRGSPGDEGDGGGAVTTLYTASYGAWRPELGAPVVTSLGVPKWIKGAASWPRCLEVTPGGHYFRAPAEQFRKAYLSQLEHFGVQRISRRLAEIARSGFAEPQDRLVILCFESVPDQCHRRTFAEWLLLQSGELAEEVTK